MFLPILPGGLPGHRSGRRDFCFPACMWRARWGHLENTRPVPLASGIKTPQLVIPEMGLVHRLFRGNTAIAPAGSTIGDRIDVHTDSTTDVQ